MHSRAPYVVSILLLLFSFAGCGKKSDDAANSANQNQMNQGGSNTAGSNTSGSNASGSNTGGSNMTGSNAAPASAPAPAPQPVVIPAGTTLTVRLAEPVGSKISTTGQTFRATLAHDVTVEGSTVIPRGASVTGTVVDAKPLGRFKGGALLELSLTSITVHGTEHRIHTAAMTTEEKGKGKRTAVMTGGGGALGAIIGGIAGGGKGAAIGAAAGAGAGVGGSAFTGNKEIVFPAESAMSFKLRSPLEVSPRE
jgi:predicted small lipoprotein YifL